MEENILPSKFDDHHSLCEQRTDYYILGYV